MVNRQRMARMAPNSQEIDASDLRAQLRDPQRTIAFMLAGSAYVTFQSRRTGNRFTYKISQASESRNGKPPPHFVALLVGPDNSRSYEFLGTIFERKAYAHGRNSKVSESATGAIAFMWVWRKLSAGQMHEELDVWHEGRCGRCGRRLTTPESIETGLGPVCAGRSS